MLFWISLMNDGGAQEEKENWTKVPRRTGPQTATYSVRIFLFLDFLLLIWKSISAVVVVLLNIFHISRECTFACAYFLASGTESRIIKRDRDGEMEKNEERCMWMCDILLLFLARPLYACITHTHTHIDFSHVNIGNCICHCRMTIRPNDVNVRYVLHLCYGKIYRRDLFLYAFSPSFSSSAERLPAANTNTLVTAVECALAQNEVSIKWNCNRIGRHQHWKRSQTQTHTHTRAHTHLHGRSFDVHTCGFSVHSLHT